MMRLSQVFDPRLTIFNVMSLTNHWTVLTILVLSISGGHAQRTAYDVIIPEDLSLVYRQDTLAFTDLSVSKLTDTFGPPDSIRVIDKDHPLVAALPPQEHDE